jgi:hemerythrin-like metal-binding protein
MARLDWNEAYATGVTVLDYEHRALIDIINSSCDALRAEGDPDTVRDQLASLYERACSHFALEEKLMREVRYELYAAHKTGHEKLVDSLRDMMDSFEDGRCRNCKRSLDECLVSWFDGHFRIEG